MFPKIKNRAFLAPMAGITDIAFRELSRKYGCGLTYTEFISSAGISRMNVKSLKLAEKSKLEKPSAIQIFGSKIDELTKSAEIVGKKFDIIDLNCGCPADKVVSIGCGAYLLKKPEMIGKIVNSLVETVKNPITIKIRLGIDDKHINAVEVAKIAQDNGASAIAVHGRTMHQGYSGIANWDVIKKVKNAIDIPVIGNGDVTSPEIFKKRIEESNVDYVMIGRGAMVNPFIFSQINSFLKNGHYEVKPKQEQFRDYLKIASKYDLNFSSLRIQAMNFSKGLENSAELRRNISIAKTEDELKGLFRF